MREAREVARLPMPERLEPNITKRSLMTAVSVHFYPLYNAAGGKFPGFLASVGNEDSLTLNRLFDRHEAVGMVKAAAKAAQDNITLSAKDGDIYRCIVHLMRTNKLGLKLRKQQYEKLTHQQAAE
jgi:hypothetical protein